MPANISNTNGIDEVFIAGAPAWHNLGVNVKNAQRWEEAVKLTHLDWTVSTVQMQNPVTAENVPFYALMRDDTHRIFNVVTKRYMPIQNVQCFDFVDALIESREAHYETAGALGHGELVWCLARLDKLSFSVCRGDLHHTYLLFIERRDGKAATVKLCDTRVVCNNTLNIALGEATGSILRLRHTSSIGGRITEAKRLVAGVSAQVGSLEDKLKALATTKITKPTFQAVLDKLFPDIDKNARQTSVAAQIASNFMSNDDNAVPELAGSAYALLNGITRFVDHQKGGFRGDSTERSRVESAFFGTGDDYKRSAFNTICEVMEISPIINLDAARAEIAELTK